MDTLKELKHENKIDSYISENYPDWSFSKFKKHEIEICENGDVHYNGNTIIKTGIKLLY